MRAPDVTIALDGNGLCSPQDGRVRYTVRIGNSGNATAYNVHVTNILGDGARIESVSLSQGSLVAGADANVSILDVGAVDPGLEIVAVVTLQLSGAPGSPVAVVARTETSTPGDPNINNIQVLGCTLAVATPEPAATAPIVLPTTGGDL